MIAHSLRVDQRPLEFARLELRREPPGAGAPPLEAQVFLDPKYNRMDKVMLLNRGAVPLGYSYVEEQEVLDGAGWVDLVFRRGEVTVACEICATTPARHEAGNLLKCLRAGFAWVVLVCDQTLKRHRIGELLA